MTKKSGQGKVVIIGIDGVPFGMMDDLSEQKVMPNFGRLKREGFFRKMRSSIPPLSSIAWASIVTGKNPGEHNIFGFTELISGTYTLTFPNFRNIKERAFWQRQDGKKYVILNVPTTYPAQPLNGVHVAGFVALDLEEAVYPNKYLADLHKLNYVIDVDSRLAHESKDLFFRKLNEALAARVEAADFFWKEIDWDVFMLVFTGSDRLGHFFWDAYEDKKHKYHEQFLDHMARIDKAIGGVMSKLNDKDSLLILSDHGMGRMHMNIYTNYVLEELGYLDRDKSRIRYDQITEKTQAFSLDPGRIFVHTKDRYPRGKVAANEVAKIVDELIEDLRKYRYKGKKVFADFYKRDEIYRGDYVKLGADLVVLPYEGFRLRGAIGKEVLADEDIFTGDHTLEDSILLVKSPVIESLGDELTVEDFVPILDQIIKGVS